MNARRCLRYEALFSCLLTLCAGFAASTYARGAEPDQVRATALLGAAVQRMGSIKTLQADVVVSCKSGDDVTSYSGRLFYSAPDKARFEGHYDGCDITFVASGDAVLKANDTEREYSTRLDYGERPLVSVLGAASIPHTDHLCRLLGKMPLVRTLGHARWAGGDRAGADTLARVRIQPVRGASSPELVLLLRQSDGAYVGQELSSGDNYSTVRFLNIRFDEPLDPSVFSLRPSKGYRKAYESDDSLQEWRGRPAPDIQLQPLAGGPPVALSSFKGRPLILNFWASWCPPSAEALGALDSIAQSGSGAGLRVICVSDETSRTVSRHLAKNRHPHLDFYLDPKGEASSRYSIFSLSTALAIDAAGVVQGAKIAAYNPTDGAELAEAAGVRIALGPDPDSPGEKAFEDGVMKFLLGDREGAVAGFAAAASAAPGNWPAAEARILALCDMGRAEEARVAALEYGNKLGTDAQNLNNLAYAMAGLDLALGEAERFARKSLSLQDEPYAQDTLGWILVKRGSFKEAVALLEMASSGRQFSSEEWYHLGRAYEGSGEKTAARMAYRQAVNSGDASSDAAARLKALETPVAR